MSNRHGNKKRLNQHQAICHFLCPHYISHQTLPLYPITSADAGGFHCMQMLCVRLYSCFGSKLISPVPSSATPLCSHRKSSVAAASLGGRLAAAVTTALSLLISCHEHKTHLSKDYMSPSPCWIPSTNMNPPSFSSLSLNFLCVWKMKILLCSRWLSSYSHQTRVQIWALLSSLLTAYNANVSIYCMSVWHTTSAQSQKCSLGKFPVGKMNKCELELNQTFQRGGCGCLRNANLDQTVTATDICAALRCTTIIRAQMKSAGHSPITLSLSAPTTTSCSSAEKSSFPEVDLTSNILPRALNPLDPKANTQEERRHQRGATEAGTDS